jgi:hypothetical protein
VTRARILTPEEVRALLAEGREGAAEMERERRKRAAAHDDVYALRAEVLRLRSLPVIATCGDCGWALGATETRCALAPDEAREIGRAIDPDSVPPDWCPLRGAR